MQKWIILIVIGIIIVVSAIIILNVDIETEYVPETEIEETELRKTIVTLYFNNKETKELSKETRLIDSKELLKNPYETLLDMLLEGPNNESLERVIPEGTKVLDANLENGIVIVNFSKEFLENTENIDNILSSITKTLIELTEVNNVKILIEGEELNLEKSTQSVENTVNNE